MAWDKVVFPQLKLSQTDREIIQDAADRLEEYRRYSDAMRVLGKGFDDRGPFTTRALISQLRDLIARSKR